MKKILLKVKKILNKDTLLCFEQLKSFYRSELLINNILNNNTTGVTKQQYFNEKIIVSLTTFSNRYYEVYLTIESLMQQTLKPNKIILWLADSFKTVKLPIFLEKQIERGLEIKYCNDIMSYKKLIPTLKLFPNDIIITFDDDKLYNYDLIENLVKSYITNPIHVSSGRLHKIKLLKNNIPADYKNWDWNYTKLDISPLNFPTGVGGVLYPPGCFSDEVFNETVFTDICKHADDIWFKAMALLNNTQAVKAFTHNINGYDYISNYNTQNTSLSRLNVDKGLNDIQLKAVFDKYNLWGKLYSK